jgi:hypothetical protein
MKEYIMPDAPFVSQRALPQTILVVDDWYSQERAEVAQAIFPAARVLPCRDYADVMATLEQGHLPDFLLLDCYARSQAAGADIAACVIDYISANAPEHPAPACVLTSADDSILKLHETRIRRYTLRGHPWQDQMPVIASNVHEVKIIKGLFQHPAKYDQHFDSDATTELRKFINITYAGFSLPLSSVEALAQGKVHSPFTVMDMLKEEIISPVEALTHLLPILQQRVPSIFNDVVILPKQERNVQQALSLPFQDGQLQPRHVAAAFTAAQVKQNTALGKDSVLILLDDSSIDVVNLMELAALAVLQPQQAGHIVSICGSHDVSSLLQLDAERGVTSSGEWQTMAGQPTALLLRKTVKESDVPLEALQQAGIEILSPISADTVYSKTEIQLVLRAGDALTVDPATHRLYSGHREIIPAEGAYGWVLEAQRLLHDWHAEQGIAPPRILAIADHAAQAGIMECAGFGMVRGEQLLLNNSMTRENLKTYLLTEDTAALQQFAAGQQRDMQAMLNPLFTREDFPVKIRLTDVFPGDSFQPAEQALFLERYGGQTRGVQLAQKLPELYPAEIQAVFAAYAELRDAHAGHNAATPLEIIVPNVQTAAEVWFVKQHVTAIAAQYGVPPAHYRFGIMLETTAACANIAELAPLCDSISIGSNDLSAAVLNYQRNDWAAINELTIASGRGEDPRYVMHPAVVSLLAATLEIARAENPSLAIGLCGAHAANMVSLNRTRGLELDYLAVMPTPFNREGLPLLYMAETFRLQQAATSCPANPLWVAPTAAAQTEPRC